MNIDPQITIEPLVPIKVPGIHAYAERSVEAGQTISLRVSADPSVTPTYEMTVVRLGSSLDAPDSSTDIPVAPFQTFNSVQQPIAIGSYVNIDEQLPPTVELPALTLECWVRPWSFDDWQGLITQYTDPVARGFALFIAPQTGNAQAGIAFYLGDGGQNAQPVVSSQPLTLNTWTHVVGVWDGTSANVWINGEPGVAVQMPGLKLMPGDAPLRLAASGTVNDGTRNTCCTLDGDMAMPVIYKYALSAAEIQARYQQQNAADGVQPPTVSPDQIFGCWPMTEETGSLLGDISSSKRHGTIINHATWMIGGPSFDSSSVGRFSDYNPATDPQRGHGLRFASDDLYDCLWTETQTFSIPATAKSGIYAGRIRYQQNSTWVYYDVTFVVRSRKRSKPSLNPPILVLCATNTWFAYNFPAFPAQPFQQSAARQSGRRTKSALGDPAPVADTPDYCFYYNHHNSGGTAPGLQPTYYVGVNMPCPVSAPYVTDDPQPPSTDIGYSHLVRAERFLHVWLDQMNFQYDVATDFDLDRDPTLLDGYQVLIINGHSEYWSSPAYRNVQSFLNRQGNLVVLSGNTMFWRVTLDENQSIIQCRKVLQEVNLGGRPNATNGEVWHSGDYPQGDYPRGGLMREAGYPAYQLVGQECAGWFDYPVQTSFGKYQCLAPADSLFNTPKPTGLAYGQSFGTAQMTGGGTVGCVGHEYDIRINNRQQMCCATGTAPAGAPPVPDEPPGIITLAQCTMDTANTIFDWYANWYSSLPGAVVSQMIYWPRPAGGRIFNAGTIGYGWALNSDTYLQNLTYNVLTSFISPTTKPGSGIKPQSVVPGFSHSAAASVAVTSSQTAAKKAAAKKAAKKQTTSAKAATKPATKKAATGKQATTKMQAGTKKASSKKASSKKAASKKATKALTAKRAASQKSRK